MTETRTAEEIAKAAEAEAKAEAAEAEAKAKAKAAEAEKHWIVYTDDKGDSHRVTVDDYRKKGLG